MRSVVSKNALTCNGLPVSSFSEDLEGLLRQRVLKAPPFLGVAATLGHYHVLRFLGAGGMGMVLLARLPEKQDHVVIKLLRPELRNQSSLRQRFLREAHHMQQLDHPSIIKVLHTCDEEVPFFVMPYCPGGSLADLLLPGKPLDIMVIEQIAVSVAEGLRYAHSKGIIHRDVKPGNILIGGKGKPYLSDFGLVRTVFNDSIKDIHQNHSEGTANYMSPAVAAGEAEDTRCDIYALGAVLYEMLTGQRPYADVEAKSVRAHIVAGPCIPIKRLNKKAKREWIQIANGAMAREHRDRYANMGDLLADIQRVVGGCQPCGPRGRRATFGLSNLWQHIELRFSRTKQSKGAPVV